MQAVQLTEIRGMQQVDFADPVPGKPTDVLLRVGTVGVCGSDIHYYTTGRIGSMVVEYPFIVGHEFAGTVIEAGSAVEHLKAGDRVAVDPAMSCGECDQCRAGRAHTCRNLRFLGCPGQAEGCLSEFVVMPASSCFRIQAETTLAQAALAEPLSIGVYAARMAALPRNAAVGILGCGPIGLSVMLAARESGAGNIYVTDRIDRRIEVARGAGATWGGNPDTEDVVRSVSEHEPLLLDVVFECCGKQEAMDQAVELLKPGGKLVFVGIPTVDRISFFPDRVRRKELCIQHVRRQNDCMQPALDLIEQKGMDVDFMITHNFPLTETKDAFDLVADYRDGVVKAMIKVCDET